MPLPASVLGCQNAMGSVTPKLLQQPGTGAVSDNFLLAQQLDETNPYFVFSRSQPLEVPMLPNSQQATALNQFPRQLQTHLHFFLFNDSPPRNMAEPLHALWLGPCLSGPSQLPDPFINHKDTTTQMHSSNQTVLYTEVQRTLMYKTNLPLPLK